MARDLLVNGEILLFGDVGDPWGWGDGFTPQDVAAALAEHGTGDVKVRLNSGGGIAVDGMAIYSLFKAYAGGKVHIAVDGIAASAASLIAMAGDTREMRDGAVMMIHDPSSIAFGTSEEIAKAANSLDKLAQQYAGVYARAAGMKADAARKIMRDETWLSADEAVEQGFATGKIADKATEVAQFDFRVYTNAPSHLPIRRKEPRTMAAAMAFARSNLAAVSNAAAAASTGGLMTDKTPAAAAAAEATAAAAAAATPAAAPAAEATAAAVTPVATTVEATAAANKAERERSAEIATLAVKHGLGEAFAAEHITKGTALDEVRKIVLAALATTDAGKAISARTAPQGATVAAPSALFDKAFASLGFKPRG